MRLLRNTLRAAASDDAVSLHVKSALVWCDSETGGQVLAEGVAARLVSELLARQRSDGGWALRELGPFVEWEGSEQDCCGKREVRADAYATGFVTLALSRNLRLLSPDQQRSIADAVGWIDRNLSHPYPDGIRYNKHGSHDAELPEFRESLYTNAGHMWAFLAKQSHRIGRIPWARD